MTLAEFLLERIDHDKSLAREIHTDDCRLMWMGAEHGWYDCNYRERILAECEAKRRIVTYCDGNVSADDRSIGSHGIAVLLMLALPYADHPDYNPEWEP
jgi:hypothetical protein